MAESRTPVAHVDDTGAPAVPLVSIVLATWNGATFLREQLQSLQAQTWPRLEIVVTDDGSTDDTVALLEAAAAADPRLRLFVGQANVGHVRNFERGMLQARGDFVALCDQDDVWLPGKIETLMAHIGEHVLVYSDSSLIDATGAPLGRTLSQLRRLRDFDDCLTYAIGGSVAGHTMLFRRELVAACVPFPPTISHDYWLGFVGTFHSVLHYVPEPLVLYRQHDANVFGAGKAGQGARRAPRRRAARPAAETRRLARLRMQTLAQKVPDALVEQKAIFRALSASYASFSLVNNWRRMRLFLRYGERIHAYRRRTRLQHVVFALKMFFVLR